MKLNGWEVLPKVESYVLSQELPVECGVNRVLIRSTKKAGKIRLVASAEGLTGADVIANFGFETKNGLSCLCFEGSICR